MVDRSLIRRQLRALGLLALLVAGAAALAAGLPATAPASNRSPAPDAPYGRCHEDGSAMNNKWTLVGSVGETARDVIAMQVLHCRHWTGGTNGKVACDTVEAAGVPYAYCARFFNDGAGNDIAIGVLRRDAVTDALGRYTGCPRDQVPGLKLDVVKSAGLDPRGVSGIVTLGCGPASGPASPATAVPCPKEPNPYGRCVGTRNDGHGNAVMLGVVTSVAADDPYALFGECNSATDIAPGFLYKADALVEAGVPLANIRGVDQIACQVPWGMGGGVPERFEVRDCRTMAGLLPLIAARFDFCVFGTDVHGNGALFGVNGRR